MQCVRSGHLPQVSGDDEISMGVSVISLRDPLTGARVKTPVRFRGTNGLASFDLDAFMAMAQRSRKWQCPHSMRHSRVQDLQIDGFVTAILAALKASVCDQFPLHSIPSHLHHQCIHGVTQSSMQEYLTTQTAKQVSRAISRCICRITRT